MSLEEFRKQIDQADDALIKAFCQRMKIAADIAAFKKEHHLPILDSGRERKKLKAVAEKAGEEMEDYATVLYALLFELSRAYQGHLLDEATELTRQITRAIEETPRLFPPKAQVACQGVEGANSQTACERLFRMPSISYFSTFDAVFSAIESGFCPVRRRAAGEQLRRFRQPGVRPHDPPQLPHHPQRPDQDRPQPGGPPRGEEGGHPGNRLP